MLHNLDLAIKVSLICINFLPPLNKIYVDFSGESLVGHRFFDNLGVLIGCIITLGWLVFRFSCVVIF
jgi:hypothetical protein